MTATVPTLLYDDSCPMCQAYTATFRAFGWADRAALGSCDAGTFGRLDLDRARHEIPLIDPKTGTISYGVDALARVIGGGNARLRRLVERRASRAMLTVAYRFVSYNRREIAGCPPPATGFDCAPDFHAGWIGAYVTAACAVTLAAARTPAAAVAAATTAAVATAGYASAACTADGAGRLRLASQLTTSVAAATLSARLARRANVPTPVAALAGILAGSHQLWRRRFLRDRR